MAGPTSESFADFLEMLGDSSFKEALKDGRRFAYRPQKDITVWELSLCIHLVMRNNASQRQQQLTYDQLPPEAQRHFRVITSDSGEVEQ